MGPEVAEMFISEILLATVLGRKQFSLVMAM